MRKPTARAIAIAIAIAIAVAITGLAAPSAAAPGSPSPTPARIERLLEARLPGLELRPEVHLRLGRIKLGAAKMLLGAMGDPDARRALRGVRRVEIADYEVRDLPAMTNQPADLFSNESLDEQGWFRMVHQRDEEEMVWVYVRQQDSRMNGVLVVSLDPYELTVVQIEGRISDLLEEMMEDEPGEIRGLF